VTSKCPICKGTGIGMDGNTCRGPCGGTGNVSAPCGKCSGSGTVEVKCPTCHGTGELILTE
jgi:DnaJ-class molecular chaperone